MTPKKVARSDGSADAGRGADGHAHVMPGTSDEDRLTSAMRYDRTTSTLMALIIVIAVPVVWLGGVWLTNQVWARPKPVDIEIIEVTGGGDPEGKVGDTKKFELDAPETDTPADPEEESLEEFQLEEMPEEVLSDIAEVAADLAEPQLQDDPITKGIRGSKEGTGERPYGWGPGEGAMPRHLRWEIVYDNRQTLEEYGRQLDFFGIELGAIQGSNEIVYVSKFSTSSPMVRRSTGGGNDQRLYMIWRSGSRRQADLQLLERAGVRVGTGIALQFVPPDVEDQLALLERQFANRTAEEISQTRFGIRREGDGFAFFVIDQQYHQ